MRLYAVNSHFQLSKIEYQECLRWIDRPYQERISNYQLWQDRQRSLLGRLLSKYALSEVFGLRHEAIHFENNAYGKPYVVGQKGIYFNVSHSKDWVLCVVNEAEVGIDVQEIKEYKGCIVDRFYTVEEKNYLVSLGEEQRLEGFYAIWSMKEAYVKALGKGLSMSMRDFSVVNLSEQIQIMGDGDRTVFFKAYDVEAGYTLAVCSRNNDFCEDIEYLSIETIKRSLYR